MSVYDRELFIINLLTLLISYLLSKVVERGVTDSGCEPEKSYTKTPQITEKQTRDLPWSLMNSYLDKVINTHRNRTRRYLHPTRQVRLETRSSCMNLVYYNGDTLLHLCLISLAFISSLNKNLTPYLTRDNDSGHRPGSVLFLCFV